MIINPPVYPAAQIAYDKFAAYIESCTNQMHVLTALAFIRLFKLRFPHEKVRTTKLSCLLQLKRIEIEYLHEIVNA